jgi:Dna[CI] antecedent, DciA
MEAMRELLRGSVGRSLSAMRDEDRLAAAWTVACGSAMADRGTVMGYERGVVWIEVADAVWMRQMISLRGTLEREMARIAGLPVAGIHFELKRHH